MNINMFDLTIFFTGIYDKFADAFSNAVKSLKMGNGFEEGVVLVITSVSNLIEILLL